MERLATLLSDAPLNQIRTKWSELSSKSLLRLAPPSSKLRTTPCAADHLPEGGPLRCEDFLILLHHFRPGENEQQWSQDALDLFKQLDVTGDGLVEWSEFADFILCARGVPSCGGAFTPSTRLVSILRPFGRDAPRRRKPSNSVETPSLAS